MASNNRGFAYDLENRLTSSTFNGSTVLALVYDPLGRLKQTVAGATTTQYLYDGDKLAAEDHGNVAAAKIRARRRG